MKAIHNLTRPLQSIASELGNGTNSTEGKCHNRVMIRKQVSAKKQLENYFWLSFHSLWIFEPKIALNKLGGKYERKYGWYKLMVRHVWRKQALEGRICFNLNLMEQHLPTDLAVSPQLCVFIIFWIPHSYRQHHLPARSILPHVEFLVWYYQPVARRWLSHPLFSLQLCPGLPFRATAYTFWPATSGSPSSQGSGCSCDIITICTARCRSRRERGRGQANPPR